MIRFFTRRFVQVVLLLALLLGATWASGTAKPWLSRLQYLTFDSFNRIKPRTSTDAVVVVDIDEESLAVLGQWPWSRDVMGRMVEQLDRMGASAIAFDVVFAERDRTSPSSVAQRLPNDPQGDAARAALQHLPDTDAQFSRAIAQSGRVVTGFVWSDRGNEGKIPVLSRGLVIAGHARQALLAHAQMAGRMVTNLPDFEKQAAGNGSFSVSTDGDGIVRRVPLVVRFQPDGGQPQLYPSLALEALRVGMGGKNSIQIMPLRDKNLTDLLKPALNIKIGALHIPVDADGQIWVYYAPVQKDRYIPAWRVLAGQVEPARLKNKIVLVGTSDEGLKNIRSSPLDLFVPGVEMLANIIEQAWQGAFISRPALAAGVEAIFIFAIGLAVIILSPFVNLFVLFGAVAALIAGAFALSWLAFARIGVLIDPVYPSLAVAVLFVLSSLLSYLRAEYERREIRGAFGLYISPDFMSELTRSPDKLKLGGEIKTLSIIFTDIPHFTTIAEGITRQALINTMNEFLTPMSDAVMRARGTIDKYMGDAMMAFWNAPLDVPDHERHAVRAALAMRGALAPVNAVLKARADAEGRVFMPLNCGIGINTGPVAVGNMGSKQRFAYSVLGDAVNLASRLEGQTKTYGLDILLGEETARNAQEFALVEIDLIKVKGKTAPVRIFTVLGDETLGCDDGFKSWQSRHAAFLDAYRHARFSEALDCLALCRAQDASDMLGDCYMVFELRIRDFITNPPPAGWDGVYTALGK